MGDVRQTYPDVWVICIEHDYGVWDGAGWFPSADAAQRWIDAEHDRRRVDHELLRAECLDDPSDGYDPGDYDECRTPFYARLVQPAGCTTPTQITRDQED